jgi:hypothetical protein
LSRFSDHLIKAVVCKTKDEANPQYGRVPKTKDDGSPDKNDAPLHLHDLAKADAALTRAHLLVLIFRNQKQRKRLIPQRAS